MRFPIAVCAIFHVLTSQAVVLPSACENAFRRALDADAAWRMERRIEGTDKTLVSTGIVSCAAKKGIVWDVRFPFRETVTMTTNSIVFADDESVRVKTLSELPHYESFRRLCDDFMDGDAESFDDVFKTEVRIGSNGVWKVVFKPSMRRMRRLVSEIEVSGVEKISNVVIRTGDGTCSRIEFVEIAPGAHSLWKGE